jgi:hypothetical protein
MKIYQLHKHGGEWEDYRDVIIGSYLRKERAEEEKLKAEKEEEINRARAKQCYECPYNCKITDNVVMADLMRKHCDHSDISFEDDEIYCKAHCYRWRDYRFYIEEVNVEE